MKFDLKKLNPFWRYLRKKRDELLEEAKQAGRDAAEQWIRDNAGRLIIDGLSPGD